jgi:RNA polymerase sigma-70 factor (ECF subfamily)
VTSDFAAMVEPYRARLRLHCYRLLGSSHDAEDMVQETFVRALRSRETLASHEQAGGWLHRIATNVCLDELAKRKHTPRARGPELGPPADPDAPTPDRTPDDEWIEPVPSAWLGIGAAPDPASQYSAKESIALAFVAALQTLTPAQRAVLLLRDVVGLSAEETAAALESSVSSANSALHRARVALEARVGPRASWSPDLETPVDRALLERYLAAWESSDLDAIVALLHEEAVMSMPPFPLWLSGATSIVRFLGHRIRSHPTAPLYGGRLIEASGRPALALTRAIGEETPQLFAVQVLETRDGKIAAVDHFMSESSLRVFVSSERKADLETGA